MRRRSEAAASPAPSRDSAGTRTNGPRSVSAGEYGNAKVGSSSSSVNGKCRRNGFTSLAISCAISCVSAVTMQSTPTSVASPSRVSSSPSAASRPMIRNSSEKAPSSYPVRRPDLAVQEPFEPMDPAAGIRHVASVAEHRHQHRLEAREPGAFELDRVDVGADPLGAGDAHRTVVDRHVSRSRDIEGSARLGQDEGVGILVEHVGGHRMRGAPGARGLRLHAEARIVEGHHDHAAHRARRAERAAFGHLGSMPGGAGVLAVHEWQGGDARGIGRPARDHDVGPGRQRLADLLGAGQRHDVCGMTRCRRGRSPARRQAPPAARHRRHRRPRPATGEDLTVATRTRWPRSLATSSVISVIQSTMASVPQVPAEPTISGTPASARASIRMRHSAFVEAREYFETPATEIEGAAVGRAAVDGDRVGPPGDPAAQRLALEAEPEHARRNEDSGRHGLARLPPPDRQGMRGIPYWREPAGRLLPAAASYLHAENHFRKLGSTLKTPNAQDV